MAGKPGFRHLLIVSYLVQPFSADDCDQWKKHWFDYMGKHDPMAVKPEVMAKNWQAVLSQDGRIHAYALRDSSGVAQGFVHYITYYCTDSAMTEAYLMDLYVDPANRGNGAGTILLDHVLAECRDRGYSKMIWITVPGVEYNERFYAKFATRRNWDRYVVDFRA